MKIIKKLGGVVLALVMLLTVCLAACNGDNGGDRGAITGLYFATEGLQTTYNVGDAFDESKVKLTAVYERGSESLTLASEGVTKSWSPEFDKDKAGSYTLTATYKGKSNSLVITYLDQTEALVFISVKPMKTAYVVGDANIQVGQIQIEAVYSSGKVVTLSGNAEGVTVKNAEGTTMSEIDLSAEGEQTLTIAYGGKTVTLTITVYTEKPATKLVSLYLDPNSLPLSYTQGAAVDLSKAKFTANYNDDTPPKPLSVGEGGVTADPATVSTANAGPVNVTFSYTEGDVTVTCEITLTVVEPSGLAVTFFDAPQTYRQFEDLVTGNRDDRDSYLKPMGTYKVGNDNAFVLVPDVQALDVSTGNRITLTSPKTEFELFKQEGGNFTKVNADDYLMTEEQIGAAKGLTAYTKPAAYYFFKENVTGVFRLKVTLDENSYTVSGNVNPFTVDFEVVDGYNVYDQTGLSVLDNLNVKHWADIKEAAGTLDWDLKPLKDYNSLKNNDVVKQVIFHSDITIDPGRLPDYYFWDKNREELKSMYTSVYNTLYTEASTAAKEYHLLLDGSLRDYDDEAGRGGNFSFNSLSQGDKKEDYDALSINMQKGIYNTAGTFVEGNGMTLSYKVEGVNPQGAVRHLYSVYDNDWETGEKVGDSNVNPTGHWSFFKYVDEKVVKDVYPDADFAEDVTIRNLTIQGSQRRLAASTGEKPELMGANTATDNITFDNCVISKLYVAVIGDKATDRSNITIMDTKILDVFSNMFYLWRSDLTITNSILKEAGGPIAILCDGSRTKAVKESPNDENGSRMFINDTDPAKKSVIQSFASGIEPWYVLNNANELFTMVKGTFAKLIKDSLGRNIVREETDLANETVELVNIIAVIICEPGDLTTDYDEENVRMISGGVYRGEEKYEMNNALVGPDGPDGAITQQLNGGLATVRATNAPIFQSGNMYAYTDLASVTGIYPLTAANQTGDSLLSAWKSAEGPTDLMFISMRANKTPTYTYPMMSRFGILIGDVATVSD